jgi:proteasome regulatory subunit
MPTAEDRVAIFKIHMKGMSRDPGIDVEKLSDACCDSTTGADIKAICTEAGMFAIRDKRDTVTRSDFMKATDKVLGKKPGAQGEVKGMFA